MKYKIKNRFIFFILLFMVMLSLYVSACKDSEENYKNDLKVTFIDREETPIINTEIVISGLGSTDLAAIYNTNQIGNIILNNIGTSKLTFAIVREDSSFIEYHDLTKEELQSGNLTIQFSEFLFSAQSTDS